MITVPVGHGIRAELHDAIFLDAEQKPAELPDAIEYMGVMYEFGRMSESGSPIYYLEN